MSLLKSIAPTRHANPPRILVHGGEKVGKSTYFAGAPNPIFIRTEDGLNGIDAMAFPLAERYEDVEEAITSLTVEDHDFQTVVIDSADWLEKLIFQKVCDDDGVESIVLAGGGYGKGYELAMNYWRRIIRALDNLNRTKGMIVGIICHSVVVQFNDPIHEPYDRYEMKLYQSKKGMGSRDMLQEWADVIGYAHKKIYVRKQDTTETEKVGKTTAKKQIVRGVDAGSNHKLALKGSPAYVAGNRYGLPEEIDLDWQSFEESMAEAMK